MAGTAEAGEADRAALNLSCESCRFCDSLGHPWRCDHRLVGRGIPVSSARSLLGECRPSGIYWRSKHSVDADLSPFPE